MIQDYFITLGILAALYVSVRVAFAVAGGLPTIHKEDARGVAGFFRRDISGSEPIEWDGKGFDSAEVSGRVHDVRENLAETKALSPGVDFKRELLLENRREQISAMAYFQRTAAPSEAEPSYSDHRMFLFVV